MVGMLGCGCCEQPELCPNVDYLKTFTDDFSPDFEPDWIISLDFSGNPAPLESLIARDGVCSLKGRQTFAGNQQTSYGLAYIVGEKTTVSGKIESSFKLVNFSQDTLASGWNENARAGIGFWSPAESRQLWFEVIKIEALRVLDFNFRDFAYSQTSSNYNIQARLGITPQLGDKLSLRLSDCVQDTFFSNAVRVNTVTCLINDTPVYSYTPQSPFLLRTCELYAGLEMRQNRFLIPRSTTNVGLPFGDLPIVKVDDFTFESL